MEASGNGGFFVGAESGVLVLQVFLFTAGTRDYGSCAEFRRSGIFKYKEKLIM